MPQVHVRLSGNSVAFMYDTRASQRQPGEKRCDAIGFSPEGSSEPKTAYLIELKSGKLGLGDLADAESQLEQTFHRVVKDAAWTVSRVLVYDGDVDSQQTVEKLATLRTRGLVTVRLHAVGSRDRAWAVPERLIQAVQSLHD